MSTAKETSIQLAASIARLQLWSESEEAVGGHPIWPEGGIPPAGTEPSIYYLWEQNNALEGLIPACRRSLADLQSEGLVERTSDDTIADQSGTADSSFALIARMASLSLWLESRSSLDALEDEPPSDEYLLSQHQALEAMILRARALPPEPAHDEMDLSF